MGDISYMIDNTKCECGHQNPVGTVLCEACGKPQETELTDHILEMRYEGAARRSIKSNPGLLDRVWNFFSSVKIAIYMIVFVLIGSALGTIYPQENTFLNIDPSTYYKETYGTIGHIYYLLGLSHTFTSWWFITLMLMIATSLVVCSIDRVVPLYRALSNQKPRKHLDFLTRQRISLISKLPENVQTSNWIAQMSVLLRKHHYRVTQDQDALLAEKYRFSRWGPYINHIGLIVFIFAVLMRSIPGWHMDQYIGFLEGEVKPIPGTPYYLKNEKFTLELYQKDEMSEEFRKSGKEVPKMFETKAVLYECIASCEEGSDSPVLQEVTRHPILVNEPLKYKSLNAFQFNYKYAPRLVSVVPQVKNKESNTSFGSFKLVMTNPESEYVVGPYTLKLKGYFPDFGLDEKGLPITVSNEPYKPAFIFQISGPGLDEGGQPYIYFPRQIDKQFFRQDDINGAMSQKIELSVASMNDVEFASYISYLNIRIDKAMPFIWFGAGISMLGLILGFYWPHRRIWLRIDEGVVTLGAHTNKNWVGLRNELESTLRKSGIELQTQSITIRRNKA
jgi:cytochrome c biogenesis protein